MLGGLYMSPERKSRYELPDLILWTNPFQNHRSVNEKISNQLISRELDSFKESFQNVKRKEINKINSIRVNPKPEPNPLNKIVWKNAFNFLGDFTKPLVTRQHFTLYFTYPTKTLNKIMKNLNECNGGDIEVITKELEITLKCPINAKRIEIPGRLEDCKHLECFDLETFLELNQDKFIMKCPICGNKTKSLVFTYRKNLDIVIDGFFYRILKSIERKYNSIIFNNKGFWRTNESQSLQDLATKMKIESTKPLGRKAEPEVIYID